MARARCELYQALVLKPSHHSKERVVVSERLEETNLEMKDVNASNRVLCCQKSQCP